MIWLLKPDQTEATEFAPAMDETTGRPSAVDQPLGNRSDLVIEHRAELIHFYAEAHCTCIEPISGAIWRIVSLTCGEQKSPRPDERSRGRDRIPPLVCRLGSEDPERRARDDMALKVEGVVDGGVHAEKPLGGASQARAHKA